MTLSDLLALKMKRTGWSRRSIAKKIGVSPQTINNIVRGSRPAIVTLCKLSQIMNEPLALLMSAAGLAGSVELAAERDADTLLADDWCTVQTVRLMRALSKDQRQRLFQVAELFAEQQQAKQSQTDAQAALVCATG